jgi:predicted membrane protein
MHASYHEFASALFFHVYYYLIINSMASRAIWKNKHSCVFQRQVALETILLPTHVSKI